MSARLAGRIWHSPTLTTWGSFLARGLSVVAVLPFVLTRLSTEEISLWYLFLTIMGLQLLIDMGFAATFTRAVAYAMGGAVSLSDFRDPLKKEDNTGRPNWETIEAIHGTMRTIYSRLALLWFGLLAALGTWAVARPVSLVEDGWHAWTAWGIIAAASAYRLYGNRYSAFLQGLNKVALHRRTEMLVWIFSIVISISALLAGGGLLGLVAAMQACIVLGVLVNRYLCGRTEERRVRRFRSKALDQKVFSDLWPSVWRSGLGILMSAGLVQGSGIFYAQVGATDEVASYLIALNLMRNINQFSQAPFYSKIPLLARLRSEGDLARQRGVASRGMSISFWVMALGIVLVGIFAGPVFELIRSNADFVSQRLWALMGIAFFAERYGAMHIQLYSITNHIVWHKANGVTGLIFVLASAAMFDRLGVYAFPLAMLAANIGFYAWYSARHSYAAFHLKFREFELRTSVIPLALLAGYFMATLLILHTGL